MLIIRLQFNLAEIFYPIELVQKVINLLDWVPITESDLIQHPIVNTEPIGSILLLYQHDQAPTG